MDPDKLLADILRDVDKYFQGAPDPKLDNLMQRIDALDYWLRDGGTLPKRWERKKPLQKPFTPMKESLQ